MIYWKYNVNTFKWEKNKLKTRIFWGLIITLIIGSFIGGCFVRGKTLENFEKELLILDLQQEKNKFTQEKLVEELKRLKMKFPYIVMAQSILETGHWKSQVFKENNNLFGMKQSTKRSSTNKGEQHGHAYYDSWRESVLDFALWQCRYLSSINTREEYLRYLKANYAEDPNYVNKLEKLLNAR